MSSRRTRQVCSALRALARMRWLPAPHAGAHLNVHHVNVMLSIKAVAEIPLRF
eukprot:COSAG01_NODE_53872_length_336_cov_0.649789_1_plen_53_part_00